MKRNFGKIHYWNLKTNQLPDSSFEKPVKIQSNSWKLYSDINKWFYHIFSALQQAYYLLQLYLSKYQVGNSSLLFKTVSGKLLSMGCSLPAWLIKSYEVGWQWRSENSPGTSKMENFETIGNSFWLLTIVGKFSILDVCEGSGHASCRIYLLLHLFRKRLFSTHFSGGRERVDWKRVD